MEQRKKQAKDEEKEENGLGQRVHIAAADLLLCDSCCTYFYSFVSFIVLKNISQTKIQRNIKKHYIRLVIVRSNLEER
jgi:hypothetical protein